MIHGTKEVKPRKDMLQPFFSKSAIRRVEFLITDEIAKILTKFRAAASENAAVNLSLGFKCLAADIVMSYTFQESLGAIDSPNFEYPLILTQEKFRTLPQQLQYFPATMHILLGVIDHLPLSFTQRFMPGLAAFHELQRVRHLWKSWLAG